MSTENYVSGQLLTAAALVASFANNIGKVGDTATSLQINGTASYSMASGGSGLIGLHLTYPNHDAGQNKQPFIMEDYVTADTRVTGDTTSYGYSTSNWKTSFVDAVGATSGFNRQANIFNFNLLLRTQNYIKEIESGIYDGVSGFTNLSSSTNIARPTAYATDQALYAAWAAQTIVDQFGIKPALLPETIEDTYSVIVHNDGSTTLTQNMMVPSFVGGSMTGREQDLQVGHLDQGGQREFIQLNADQNVRTPSGGMPGTVASGVYNNALAGSFVNKAFRTGGNVLNTVDSRSANTTFTCYVSAARTTTPSNAIAGALTLQTAPTPPSGGTVLHVDGNGSPGTGIGAFTWASYDDSSGTPMSTDNLVSTSKPLFVTGQSGAIYQVVGVVLDGSGTDGGYLVFSGAVSSGDSAIGATFTVTHYVLTAETGQRLSLESSGQKYLDWEPSAFNAQGGHVFHGAGNNVWVGGNLMLGQNDGNYYSLIFTPYNELNTTISLNPYTNSLNFMIDGYLAAQMSANAVGGLTIGALVLLSTGGIVVGSDCVLKARQTGWTAGTATTNTPNKGAMNYDSPTLNSLAARMNALEQAMFASTGHGLIGST